MDQKTEIALFRYRIICEVLNGNRKNKSQHFKELAKREYRIPGKQEEVKFSWRTFKKWLFLYNRYGFDGLIPCFRIDKNKSRKISKALQEAIINELEENDPKTISNFYRHLIRKELITPEMFTEATLRNFLKRKKITFTKDERKARKSFEMPHINMLWTADFMHGPYLIVGRKKRKTYLCVIIDECHYLKNENFFELQIISNFNMDSFDPCVVILAAQSHLNDRLQRSILRCFNQRISIKYHFNPLGYEESKEFILHTFKSNGVNHDIFTEPAFKAIFKISGGILRTIGKLTVKTLSYGAVNKKQNLTEEDVFIASNEL